MNEPEIAIPVDDEFSRPRRNYMQPVLLQFLMRTALIALAIAPWFDWDRPEFGRHPDEAAHFVTGTLVGDWLAWGCPRDFVGFGLQYYGHYPKVALGHWPPFFYVLQGLWYSLFGVGRYSAVALNLTIASSFLALLYTILRIRTSALAAGGAVIMVALSPVFRYGSALFMADTLVALLSLGAIGCFVAFLKQGTLLRSLGFSVLSALAILTKQDAIVLAAVPPVSVVLLRRWDLLRDWRVYLPVAVVLIFCAPYYLTTLDATQSTWDGLARRSVASKLGFLITGGFLQGWPSLALSVLGCAAVFYAWWREGEAPVLGVVLLAQAIGIVAVQVATPVSLDPRYKIAFLPFAAFLAAVALCAWLRWPRIPGWLRIGGAVGAVIAFIGFNYADVSRKVVGYRQAVASFAAHRDGEVVLVCSDPMGDGAVTAEFRLQEPTGRFILLRADKLLASSTWMNQRYQLRYQTPEAVADYLARQPVHYVLVDPWGEHSGKHYWVLKSTLESRPDLYPLEASFPIARRVSGNLQRGEARLYRVAANDRVHPEAVELSIPGLPRGGKFSVRTGGL